MDIETIQIHLSSKNGSKYNNGTMMSDIDFYLPTIEIPSQHSIYLSCTHALIPYTFYNIDYKNNYLSYTINGISKSLTIDSGNYNATQLAAYLTTWMDTGFIVTYNVITNKFTITNSTYNFSLNVASTCFELLGFLATDTVYLQSVLKILTSEFSINLFPKQCICVQTNLQTGNINLSNTREGTILTSMAINCPPSGMITYINYSGNKSNLYTNVISYINIKLVDQDNNNINLNNANWSMTLQLDVVKFVE